MGGFSHGGAGETPVYRCSRGCGESSVITGHRIEEYVRELVLDRLRGLELEAAGAGIDLAGLAAEYDAAEAELRTFASDVNARRLLGEAAWQEALSVRGADRDAKREARERAYTQSRLATVAQDVEDLDHDGLRDLRSGMIRTMFVRRRPRGATVADRVLVIWSDDSRAIDVPGPHRPGPFEPVRW
jgi:hypothetical protein